MSEFLLLWRRETWEELNCCCWGVSEKRLALPRIPSGPIRPVSLNSFRMESQMIMASSRRSRWRDFLFPRTEDKIYNTTNVLLIRGLVTVIFFPLFSCFLLKMNNNKAVCYTFATQSHIYSWLTVLYMAMANDLPFFLWSFFGSFFWGIFCRVASPHRSDKRLAVLYTYSAFDRDL